MAPSPAAARPRMPAGYGLNSDTSGLLPWSWADQRLATARNYWLATTGGGGDPHVTPVWGVWRDRAFFFGTDPASRKGRNLAGHARAVVHLESGDEAVIVVGGVGEERDAAVVAAIVAEYRTKYSLGEDFRLDPCLVLRPDTAMGWREADFPSTATRWTF